ncbi:MAG: PD40 domain-containing protein [Phycisphaeraceae bacterium]|nr:PD40 domain-containing protein [Phycisphaeraceae bacterium]
MPRRYWVSIVALDSQSQQPLGDASSEVVDTNGNRIPVISPGVAALLFEKNKSTSYTITTTHSDYQSQSIIVNKKDLQAIRIHDDKRQLSLSLTPRHRVKFSVLDEKTQQAVEGAEICLKGPDSSIQTLNPGELVTLRFSQGGTYQATVSCPNYEPFTQKITKENAKNLGSEIPLAIKALYRVRFSVMDAESGKVIPNANLDIRDPQGDKVSTQGTAPLFFRFPKGEPQLGFHVAVTCPGYESRQATIMESALDSLGTKPGYATDVNISLSPQLPLRFVVQEAGLDRKLKQTTMTITDSAGKIVVEQVPANQQQTLTYRTPNETYSVVMAYKGFHTLTIPLQRRDVPLPVNGISEILVELKPDEYVERADVMIVHDRKRGTVGRIRHARRYLRGGANLRAVHVFQDNPWVRGLAVTVGGIGEKITRLAFAQAFVTEDLTQKKKGELVSIDSCVINEISLGKSNGGVAQLTPEDGSIDIDPFYSPDGEFLLYATNRQDPVKPILVRKGRRQRIGFAMIHQESKWAVLYPSIDTKGTFVFQFTPTESSTVGQRPTIGKLDKFPARITVGRQPQVNRTGDKIVYIGDDGNVWMIDKDGRANQITEDAQAIAQDLDKQVPPEERDLFAPYANPTWIPDKDYIVVMGMAAKGRDQYRQEDIYILSLSGEQKWKTENLSSDRFPVCTDKMIYFLSNRNDEWSIYAVDIPNEILRQE